LNFVPPAAKLRVVQRVWLPILVGALTAVAATASPAAQARRVVCGGKALDFYFWPQGHPAIPKIGFPAFAPPHMEIYRGGSVANNAELAYIGTSSAAFAKSCRPVGDMVTKWGGGTAQSTTARAKLSCTFRSAVELKAIPGTPGSEQLIVTKGHTPNTLVYASIGTAGSRLNFDSRYCKLVPIPGLP
jgi:hypothetical protein